MKLAYIKLLSRYRSLPKGFEMRFDTETPQLDKVSPICFVGRNGSGKSNVMEFLAEVFYYLETIGISQNRESIEAQLKLSKDLGFEMELEYHAESDMRIKFVKRPNEFLFDMEGDEDITVKGEELSKKGFNWSWLDYATTLYSFMPEKVIGYSSGMNELLSNPFLRMQFQYYKEYIQSVREQLNQVTDTSRLFYMSYQTNETVLLANYLIEPENTEGGNPLAIVNKHIRAKDIDSFRIEIETNHLLPIIEVNDETITPDEPLEAEAIVKLEFDETRTVWLLNPFLQDIEKLKKCATSYHEGTERIHRQVIDGVECEYPVKRLVLDFKVNKATKAAFKHYFGTSKALFDLFNRLTLLNIHKFTSQQIETVKNAERDFNISAFLPRIAKDALIFHISDLKMVKESGDVIPYSGLSDGEHQFMHIIGTAILMNEPDTIFLLDEPETHFNPMWRAKLVSTLNKVAGDVTDSRQVFILTTHSPFVLSDCRSENVWRFNSDDKEIAKSMAALDIKTYGTSFEALLSDAFGKEESVSEMVNEYILELYKDPSDTLEDIELIKDKAYALGDSVEKTMLIDFLNRKKRSLQSHV